MEATDVETARRHLGTREGIPKRRWPKLIGAWPEDSSECILGIEEWARVRELDAIVWTALGANFEGRQPLGDHVSGTFDRWSERGARKPRSTSDGLRGRSTPRCVGGSRKTSAGSRTTEVDGDGREDAEEERTASTNTRCALCGASLMEENASREHVFPNAIGGRKKVRSFLCAACNSKTGHEWDNELVGQLRPLCTMLNVRRERGENRPFDVETVGGRDLTLKPDGSMTIARPVFQPREVDGNAGVRIRARTMGELRRMLSGLKKDHPEIDVNELVKQAERVREYSGEPYAVPLNVGGLAAGRSMVKSCLAMVYDAGLDIGHCEEAGRFLVEEGPPCFQFYTERDVVRNRPEKTFFHCVHVRGDPERRQLISYVEYFGWLRYIARLSKDYDGHAFSHCHGVDPVSGEELDLDVLLDVEPADYEEINEGRSLDFAKVGRELDVLVGAWKEMDMDRARTEAIKDAIAFARETCGFEKGEILSDEQNLRLAKVISHRLLPFVVHMVFGSHLSEDDLRAIERKLKEGSK